MCMECGQMLDTNSNSIYRPIPNSSNNKLLKDCVLTLSGFQGCERDSLCEIAQTMGVTIQEAMSRTRKKTSNGDYLATTHLLLNSAEGSKYNAAIKWKIPTVNPMWLIQCAIDGQLLPWGQYVVPDHLITVRSDSLWKQCSIPWMKQQAPKKSVVDSPVFADFPMESPIATIANVSRYTVRRSGRISNVVKDNISHSTPVFANPRIQALRKESLPSSPGQNRNSSDHSDAPIDTPNKFLDPNKTFHPRFDLGAARNALGDSVDKSEDSLIQMVNENLAQAVKNTESAPMVIGSPSTAFPPLIDLVDDDEEPAASPTVSSSIRTRKKSQLTPRRKELVTDIEAALLRPRSDSASSVKSRCVEPLSNTTSTEKVGSANMSANRVLGWDDQQQIREREKIGGLSRHPTEPTQGFDTWSQMPQIGDL